MPEPALKEFIVCANAYLAEPANSETAQRLLNAFPIQKLEDLTIATDDDTAAELAAHCLGWLGTMQQSPLLASTLRNGRNGVAHAAELALWRIWMRGGSRWAVDTLNAALAMIKRDELGPADEHLAAIAEAEPEFAEPHHQRGIVASLNEQPRDAANHFRRALRYNPQHFAAAAGAGHAFLELEVFEKAWQYYAHAVEINPRLAEVQALLHDLRPLIEDQLDRRPT